MCVRAGRQQAQFTLTVGRAGCQMCQETVQQAWLWSTVLRGNSCTLLVAHRWWLGLLGLGESSSVLLLLCKQAALHPSAAAAVRVWAGV